MTNSERGMATAEFAVAMPAVVLVLVVSLAGVGAGVDHVRCIDAARLAARALARGDSAAMARSLASTAAPPAATVTVGSTAATVSASVSVTRRAPGLGVSWTIRGSALAPLESAP